MTASVGQSRARVLRLYRKILRTGHSWEGPAEEKSYILTEAKKSFKDRQNVLNDHEASKMIREGEERLEYAVHYRIPYPRLKHANQFPKRYFMQAPEEDVAGSRPTNRGTGSNSKLEEAIKRRKEKQKSSSD